VGMQTEPMLMLLSLSLSLYIYIYINIKEHKTEINFVNNNFGWTQTSSYMQPCPDHSFFLQKMYASANSACTSWRL
jgi:hypothetical protein